MNTCIYLRKSRADIEAEKEGQFETLARHKTTLLNVAKENNLNIVQYKMFDENNNFNLNDLKDKILDSFNKQNKALVIINSPLHNPTGYSLTNNEWKELVRFINEDCNNKEVILGCRPEHVRIQENGIKCKVNFIEQLGTESILYGDILLENNSLPVVVKIPANTTYESDQIIYIGFDSTNLHFFDKESEVTILKEIPEQYELDVEIKNNKITLFNNEFKLPTCMNLENGNYKVIVPSNILCKGNDFKVQEESIEMIKNTKLAKIKVNDRYIHLIVDSLDESMNASILFENLTFIKNDEVIIKPINKVNRFEGTIDKIGKKKDVNYFFNIENNKCDVDMHKLQKVALIDGETHEVVDILECRYKHFLCDYFKKFPKEEIEEYVLESDASVFEKYSRKLDIQSVSSFEESLNEESVRIFDFLSIVNGFED